MRNLSLYFLMLWFCFISMQGLAADEIEIMSDVVCGKAGQDTLHMDVALPSNREENRPCIVVIHGGAWRHGDKKLHEEDIKRFARQGYVSASLAYRLCPKDVFPAQIEDVKCAIRYLRAHAKQYRIDPERIGAVGFSAGGHLSMMLGTMDQADGLEGGGGWANESSKVQAVVSYFGPTQLDAKDIPAGSLPLVSAFIGGSAEEKPQAYSQASPLTYVDRGDAPMLLFQGTNDVLVPHTQAIKMINAMTRARVPGRIEFLINADHGWGGDELERTRAATFRFFKKHLRESR